MWIDRLVAKFIVCLADQVRERFKMNYKLFIKSVESHIVTMALFLPNHLTDFCFWERMKSKSL